MFFRASGSDGARGQREIRTMKLYLVRHGEAVHEQVDPQRPLSDAGRRGVQRVADHLAPLGLQVKRILHSGKARAEQTAALLAPAFGGAPLEQAAGLNPNDSTEPFARTVAEYRDDTMVVGHLPFMGKLVSRLVTGDERRSIVSFPAGAVVCLERGEETGWSIDWIVSPELVAGAE
jgi:phosphohistidine phosphatase